MATINPPNLYTAGNVVFNTQPSTNFAIQLLQQKKAKDEALEQYYQKLPQTINEAGMRDNERPKFMQHIGDLQTYWRDNREAIKNPRKDGGAAQYNYEKKFREIRELVDASKQLAKDDLELGKQWRDPNKRYIFRNDKIVDRISKHNIPYGDPGHERLDLYSITQPPKPRTVADWQQLNKTLTDGLQIGETPTGKVEDLGNFKKRTHILKQHSPQNLKTIGEKAISMYETDYDWQGEADAQYEEALKNPKALEPYNQVFEQVMQRPIKNAGDLFAAQRIVEQSKAVIDFKDEVDRKAEMDYRFGQQVKLKSIPQATSGGSGSGSGGGTINDLYSVIDGLASQKRSEGRPYLQVNLLPADAQNVVMEFARKNTGKNDLGNDSVKIIKMDDGQVALYQVVKKMEGNKRVYKDVLVGFLTPTAINMKVQADVKGKRGVVSQGNASPKPSSKNNDPLGLGL
jgi:hypothetical protein